jgi:hypothetical protein
VQDPTWPEGLNNTLLTGDWTIQKIFRHPLAPKGASFAVQQEDFITVPRPADLVMDAASNLYVASLSGGQFTYNTDTVGYVVRVRHTGKPGATPPQVGRLSDAELVGVVTSDNAVHRLHAQQELLRRGPKDPTVRALQQAIGNARLTPEARVAAIFTLKQLAGARATPTLLQAAAAPDARVRASALRALADRRDQLAGVTADVFVRALRDADGHVQAQGIAGLVRLGAREAADAIVPLTGSADQALQHLAVNAVAALGGRDAALRAVDAAGSTPALRAGALRALAMTHDPATVTALLDRLGRARDAGARAPLLRALARLHNREGYWRGDWWTTKPAHLGPYFDPAAWEESPRIRAALGQALAAASGAEFGAIVDDYVLNQVLPRGAKPLLAALTTARDPQRAQAIETLVGRTQLDPTSLAFATELDRRTPALRGAVAQLLAGESTFGAGAIPIVRTAVLDTKLEPAIRAQLLNAMGQVSGPGALDAAAEVFGRLNPVPGLRGGGHPRRGGIGVSHAAGGERDRGCLGRDGRRRRPDRDGVAPLRRRPPPHGGARLLHQPRPHRAPRAAHARLRGARAGGPHAAHPGPGPRARGPGPRGRVVRPGVDAEPRPGDHADARREPVHREAPGVQPAAEAVGSRI